MLFRSMAALAVAVLVSSTASAGAIGSSSLSLSGIRLVIVDQDDNFVRVVTGGFGNPTLPTSSSFGKDLRVTGSNSQSEQTVQLSGFGFDNTLAEVNISGSGVITQADGGFNPAPIMVGDGGGPSGPNYVRTDSEFGGAFIDIAGLSGPGSPLAPEAFGNTFADFNVDLAGVTGGGNVYITNTSQASFIPSSQLRARVEFDAELDLFLSDSGSPPNFLTTAESGLTLALTGTGGNIAIANSEANDLLTESISVANGGTASLSRTVNFRSETFNLLAGVSYTFQLTQSSTVNISQVPEPSSLAIFGVMGVAGLAVGRRKLKKS